MSPADALAVMERYACIFKPNEGFDGRDMDEAHAVFAELVIRAAQDDAECSYWRAREGKHMDYRHAVDGMSHRERLFYLRSDIAKAGER